MSVKNYVLKEEQRVSILAWVALGMIILLVLSPELFGSSTGMPWEGPLVKIRDSLSGPVAGAVSLIGVVAAGAGLIFGQQEMGGFMKTIVVLILVISLIITANVLIQMYSGTGALILSTLSVM